MGSYVAHSQNFSVIFALDLRAPRCSHARDIDSVVINRGITNNDPWLSTLNGRQMRDRPIEDVLEQISNKKTLNASTSMLTEPKRALSLASTC